MESGMKMKVEIWSDIMCPFCYIGKRNFESALGQLHDSKNIEVEWKSFQLDPGIPEYGANKLSIYQYLAERKGMSVAQSEAMHHSVSETAKRAGLEYNFDKAIVANSFKAHRLIQYAKTKDLGDAMEEQLFHAYFTGGKDIANEAVLVELGKNIGLGETDVSAALSEEDYADKVRNDISEARQLGVNGVPFFVFNRRYAISGAQPPEAFLQALQKSFSEWRDENNASLVNLREGNSCIPGSDGCR